MPAEAAAASRRRSSSAFAVALAVLTSTKLINRCWHFNTMSALQAAMADFLSSAAMILASFVALRSKESCVLVRGHNPERVGQAPGGGVDLDLLEFCDKSQVVLGDSAAVGSEASGRSGNGKTRIHIRSASGLGNREQRSGGGSSRHGRG